MKQQTEDLIARGKELLAALSDFGMPMSPAAWHNTGDDAPANGQASREMRALHRATVAFSDALNSATNLVEKINKLAPGLREPDEELIAFLEKSASDAGPGVAAKLRATARRLREMNEPVDVEELDTCQGGNVGIEDGIPDIKIGLSNVPADKLLDGYDEALWLKDDVEYQAAEWRAEIFRRLNNPLPPDVVRLVISARKSLNEVLGNIEIFDELHKAVEAFSSRVPFENELEDKNNSALADEGLRMLEDRA